jgi:hypothetical protein
MLLLCSKITYREQHICVGEYMSNKYVSYCKLHANYIQYLQTTTTAIIGKQIVQLSAIKFPTAWQWLDHLLVTQQCWQSLQSLWRPDGTEIYFRACRKTRTWRNAVDQSAHTYQSAHTFPPPTFIPSLIFHFLTFLTTLMFSPSPTFSAQAALAVI